MSQPGVLNLRVIGAHDGAGGRCSGIPRRSVVPRASAVPAGDFPDGLAFGGLQRSYLVHVPPGLEQPTGLVINLHGAGMTGGAQAAMTNYNAVADQHGFVVVVSRRHRPQLGRRTWRFGARPSGCRRCGLPRGARRSAHAGLRHRPRPGIRHRNVGGRIHGQPAGVFSRRRLLRRRSGCGHARLRVPVQSFATRVRPECPRHGRQCRAVHRWPDGGAGRGERHRGRTGDGRSGGAN